MHISLQLSQSRYSPGEALAGSVVVEAERPIHLRGVRLKVAGSEETRIQRRMHNGGTKIYAERAPLSDEEMTLFGEANPPSMGEALAENIGAIFGKSRAPELPAGRHEYPFQWPIPGDWPPTYEGHHAWVRYEVEARVDIPLKPDMRDSQPLIVTAPLVVRMRKPRPMSFNYPEHRPRNVGVFASLSQMFAPDIGLTVMLEDKAFQRGGEMRGTLALDNPDGRPVSRALLELACFEVARAGRINEKTVLARAEEEVLLPENAPAPIPFCIRVPESAPASGEWRHFDIKWYLHVRLDIPLMPDVRCLRKVVVG